MAKSQKGFMSDMLKAAAKDQGAPQGKGKKPQAKAPAKKAKAKGKY